VTDFDLKRVCEFKANKTGISEPKEKTFLGKTIGQLMSPGLFVGWRTCDTAEDGVGKEAAGAATL
jgi:hypothetical protein